MAENHVMINSIKSLFSFSRVQALIWVCAFICALYPINDWQLWFFFFAVSITFLWSFFMLSKTMMAGWRLPKTSILYVAGAFWILAGLSVFSSDIKPISFMALCFFSMMPLIFFSSIIGGHEDYFKKIAKPMALIFAVLSVWAVIQYLFLNEYFEWQARHPLADPSSLGALLSLGLFCALGWVLAARTKTQKYLAVALSAALLCGIISTVARGPILAFIPAILIFIWLLWPQVKSHKVPLFCIILIGVLYYGVGYLGFNQNMDIGQRLITTITNGVSSEHSRLSIWDSAVQIVKDYPLLGTGIGTFFLYFPEYRANTFQETIYLAHNDPLQFATEMGILAPILFYLFIIFAAFRTFKSLKILKNQDDPRNDKIIIVTIFCALTALVLGAHVGFNHYNLSILMVEGILLGLWFVVTSRVLNETIEQKPMPKFLPQSAYKLLLVTPYVLSGYILFGLVAGEAYTSRAAQNLFQEDMFSFGRNINMAGNISHDQNYRAYILAVNVPLAILDFKKDKIEKDEALKLYNQVTSYMNKVLEINPRSAPAYYYLAKVQSLVPSSIIPKGTIIPEDYYKKALKLDPSHLGARLALNNLYAGMQKPLSERVAFMEEGFLLHYTTPIASEYYDEMAKLYLESKNYVKAKGAMTKNYTFKERSAHSLNRQNTSIPQAFLGKDEELAPE